MILTGRMCSHCHTLNLVGAGTWPYCSRCGHMADRPRADCECQACVRAFFPEMLEVDDRDDPDDPWRPREGGAT